MPLICARVAPRSPVCEGGFALRRDTQSVPCSTTGVCATASTTGSSEPRRECCHKSNLRPKGLRPITITRSPDHGTRTPGHADAVTRQLIVHLNREAVHTGHARHPPKLRFVAENSMWLWPHTTWPMELAALPLLRLQCLSAGMMQCLFRSWIQFPPFLFFTFPLTIIIVDFDSTLPPYFL